MTTDDRFATSLSSWLHEDAAHRVPGHLAETLVQTAATRQRPWWSSLERLLPMSSITMGGRVAARTPILLVLALGLLLAALVGIALVAGQPTRTIPTALPSNGRIVAVDGTSLVTFAPDGSDRQVLAELPSADVPTISMSPDGTHVAFRINSPYGIQVVRLLDGTTTTIPVDEATAIGDEYIGWSPDGTELAFAALTGRGEELMVAAADGSSVRSLRDSVGASAQTIWQPTYSPDGEWIAFAGRRLAATHLFVIHPDGTGLRELDLGLVSPEQAMAAGPSGRRTRRPTGWRTRRLRGTRCTCACSTWTRISTTRSGPASGHRGRRTAAAFPDAVPQSGRSRTCLPGGRSRPRCLPRGTDTAMTTWP
jgi:hypothetical protein